jgi:hypothetical protein
MHSHLEQNMKPRRLEPISLDIVHPRSTAIMVNEMNCYALTKGSFTIQSDTSRSRALHNRFQFLFRKFLFGCVCRN